LKTSLISLLIAAFTLSFCFGLTAQAHNTPMIAPLVGKKSAVQVKRIRGIKEANSRFLHPSRRIRVAQRIKRSKRISVSHRIRTAKKDTIVVAATHKRSKRKAARTTVVVAKPIAGTGKAASIACTAASVATKMGSTGYCYRGVKRALNKFGVELTGCSAYMAKDILKEDERFKVVGVNEFDDLQPGDILVHGKSKVHPNGHIAVYLGDGQEASDHVQKLVTKGRYGTAVVFRMKG
jgi:hypothetical protein